MNIGNDRLYLAAREIAFGQDDVRKRVTTACQIMNAMNSKEVDINIRRRIDSVLNQASAFPAMRNYDGNVIAGYDSFEVSARKRHKSTYVPIAEEIFSIYEDELSSRKMK